MQYVRSPQGKKTRQRALKADLRERKEKLKTRGEYMKAAQASFNKYVRERDRLAGRRCISCDKYLSYNKNGGETDAGHYLSRGSSAGHSLRFHLWNVHSQCVTCNRFKQGASAGYRVGLVWRIGYEKVEWLENHDHEVDFSIEYLKRIDRIFKKKRKIMLARSRKNP